jgi:endoglucanase
MERGIWNNCVSFFILFILVFILPLKADHDYIKAFNMATRFFGAQRCGDTKSWIHGPCHTQDGQSAGVDLKGGWHDCGDHVKFGQTNAYSAAVLLFMYHHFTEIYKKYGDTYSPDYSSGSPNGIPDVLDEVKIFTDYLLKACTNGKVYYQVGNAQQDHSNCSEPEFQSTLGTSAGGDPRKVYSVTSGASNFCGSAAAALALMYLSYKEFDESYANQCLSKAKEYYQIGDAKHESVGSQDGQAYEGDYWGDDMALGAIELYNATREQKYLDAANGFHNESDDIYCMPTYFFMDFGNCAPIANYEIFKYYSAQVYKQELRNEVQIMKDSTKNSMTQYGYAHYDAHNDEWASLKYAAAGALVSFLYYEISKDESAYEFGKKNVDFILGSHNSLCTDAPANFSFLIGYNELGGGSPDQPHHCSAFGRTNDADWQSWNDPSVPNNKELPGALVGGPKAPGTNYYDKRSDAVANEVCIYYNAPLVGALAYVIKKEYTDIKHLNVQEMILKNGFTAAFKIAGDCRIDMPGGIDPAMRLIIYDSRGRKLGTVSVKGRKSVNVKKELGISSELLIIKPEIKK